MKKEFLVQLIGTEHKKKARKPVFFKIGEKRHGFKSRFLLKVVQSI